MVMFAFFSLDHIYLYWGGNLYFEKIYEFNLYVLIKLILIFYLKI